MSRPTLAALAGILLIPACSNGQIDNQNPAQSTDASSVGEAPDATPGEPEPEPEPDAMPDPLAGWDPATPRLVVYPVRGPHNNGYEAPSTGNPDLWSCDDGSSNSDFVAGDHLGNDIWAARGTPVAATVPGTLVYTGFSDYSGNKVTIKTDGGWYHFMCHLDEIASGMVNGKRVDAGEIIGTVGRTGTASNGVVHLHYSIYPNDNYNAGINPWQYLHEVENDVCD